MPHVGWAREKSRCGNVGFGCGRSSRTGTLIVNVPSQPDLPPPLPLATAAAVRLHQPLTRLDPNLLVRQDGDVRIESERGHGTTVRLLLPIVAADEPPTAVAEVALPPLPRLRILCIDDEPLLRGLLQEMLDRDGHDVEVQDGARHGLAALLRAKAEGRPFDVVLTDLGMPYIDGREVARVVKASRPETGVILLTGWGAQIGRNDKLPPHVDHVLAKPPKLNQLRDALRRVMRKDVASAA